MESLRVRLARMATAATEQTKGVVSLEEGVTGRHCTWAGTEQLPGVTVLASGEEERFAVTVYVRAELLDLQILAANVRRAIEVGGKVAGLAREIGEIGVVITDVALDGVGGAR